MHFWRPPKITNFGNTPPPLSTNNRIRKHMTNFKTPIPPSPPFLATNYRRISFLPCFLKVLERIMYNRFHPNLDQNKVWYIINNLGLELVIQTIIKWLNQRCELFLKKMRMKWQLTFFSLNFSDTLRSNGWSQDTGKFLEFSKIFIVWKSHFRVF